MKPAVSRALYASDKEEGGLCPTKQSSISETNQIVQGINIELS
jgi:hypothetical protein